MSFRVERVIAAHHPALAGHFPGDPVVPGVVILEEVLQAVRAWRGNVRLKAIHSVKFNAPLGPGDVFSIVLRESNRDEIVFECRRSGSPLASGTLAVESEPDGA